MSDAQRQNVLLTIHEAIHRNNCTTVRIGKTTYPIKTLNTGSRYVQLADEIVMEQDKNKNTSFAVRARQGEQLSWVVPKDTRQPWRLIEGRTTNVRS